MWIYVHINSTAGLVNKHEVDICGPMYVENQQEITVI